MFTPVAASGLARSSSFLGLSAPFAQAGLPTAELALQVSNWTFNLVKSFQDELRGAAETGGGWFVNVTGLDGQFGLADADTGLLAAAGTVGIVKTLAREAPKLTIKNIDLDPRMPPQVAASRLLDESAAGDGLLEVGLTAQGRWRLDLQADPIPRELSPLPLDADSVVVITGGAFGVTADIAKALAKAARPHLILVGRSPGPDSERARDPRSRRAGPAEWLITEARAKARRWSPRPSNARSRED